MYQTGWRFVWTLRPGILVLGLVGRAGSAKPALVMSLINRVVSFRRFRSGCAPPKFADALIVKGLAGAHEHVVPAVLAVQAKFGCHLFEIADYVIGLFFGRAVRPLGGAFLCYSVLIGAGEKNVSIPCCRF